MSTAADLDHEDPTPSPAPASAIVPRPRLTPALQAQVLRRLADYVERGLPMAGDVEAVLIEELEDREDGEAADAVEAKGEGAISLEELDRELGL